MRINLSGWLWRRVGLGADLTRLLKWSTRSLALTTAVKAVAGQVSIRGIFQAGIRNRIKLDIRKVPDLQQFKLFHLLYVNVLIAKMTHLLFLASQVQSFHAQVSEIHLKREFKKDLLRIYPTPN